MRLVIDDKSPSPIFTESNLNQTFFLLNMWGLVARVAFVPGEFTSVGDISVCFSQVRWFSVDSTGLTTLLASPFTVVRDRCAGQKILDG